MTTDALVAPGCLSCETGVAPANGLGLCPRCRSSVVDHSTPRCRGCANRLQGPTFPADGRCGACRRRPPPWSCLWTLWDYAPPADQVLRALKFLGVEALADRIAQAAWDRHAERLSRIDTVVPVPLPWTRRVVRGFNQSESIARPLAARLGIEVSRPLRRAPSLAMSGAGPAERRRRARRSIHARRRARVPPRVLLVDDVFTTGATLSVATRRLRQAGAREVVALTPFWTPPAGSGPQRAFTKLRTP